MEESMGGGNTGGMRDASPYKKAFPIPQEYGSRMTDLSLLSISGKGIVGQVPSYSEVYSC